MSNASTQLDDRLTEIDQLIEAHSALVKFKRAESQAAGAGKTLADISTLISDLFSDVQPGRPAQVYALNNAAFVLLAAHLQGYITDVFKEAVRTLLTGKVKDVESVVSSAPTQINLNLSKIEKLFAGIGIPKALDRVSWQRMSNDGMKKKLSRFNETRNRIAHGAKTKLSKVQVKDHLIFTRKFAEIFDSRLADEIEAITGNSPW